MKLYLFKTIVLSIALATTSLSATANSPTNREIQSNATDSKYLKVLSSPVYLAQSADDYFNRGVNYFKSGELDLAILNFSQAINLNPDDSEAFRNRGKVYDKRSRAFLSGANDWPKALEDYTKAIELNPQYFDAYFDRATLYLARSLREAAVEDLTKAIELNSTSSMSYYNRGVAYEGLRQPEKAYADFDKAIQLDSQYADAYYGRGRLNYTELENTDNQIGNLVQSRQDLEKAAQLSLEQGKEQLYQNTQEVLKLLGA